MNIRDLALAHEPLILFHSNTNQHKLLLSFSRLFPRRVQSLLLDSASSCHNNRNLLICFNSSGSFRKYSFLVLFLILILILQIPTIFLQTNNLSSCQKMKNWLLFRIYVGQRIRLQINYWKPTTWGLWRYETCVWCKNTVKLTTNSLLIVYLSKSFQKVSF